jgi:hypothetical protein
MILTVQTSEKIFACMNDLVLSNNGYTTTYHKDVADAMAFSGFPVISSSDLHGKGCFKIFTQQGQDALRNENFGINTYMTPSQVLCTADTVDYEGLILARQEAQTMDF